MSGDSDGARRIMRWLGVAFALLLLGGEVLLVRARHAAHDAGAAHHGFAFESWPGFHALFGLLAGLVFVLAARELRRWIARPEDYYGD